MRAWVARPDALRVEDLQGAVLVANHEPPRLGSRALLTTGGGQVLPDPPPAAETAPVYDEDGFVAERPREARYDDPMFQSYHWVAMLDPVELADGADHQSPSRARVGPPVLFEEIAEVDYGGRLAWEALCRPSVTYRPRCSCCALLLSPQSDALDGLSMPGGFVFAEVHRVRLDVQTGVCVDSQQLGGTHDGWGHEVKIEAVDEPMPEPLFTHQRHWPRRSRSGR